MNSIVRPIFDESFVEKRGLCVYWTVHETHWKSISFVEMCFSKKKKGRGEGGGGGEDANANIETFITIQIDTWS